MRTTLNLPAELLQEALDLLGYHSKTDVVIEALRQLVRAQKREALKELAGNVEVQVDVAKSRRRKTSESL